MTLPDPYAGMSDADKARCIASDATLAGIIRGRRAAAQAVLARNMGPAAQTRLNWEPIRQAHAGLTAPPPRTYPSLNPPPFVVVEGGGPVDDTQAPTAQTAGQVLSGHRLVVPAPGDTVVYADHTHLSDLGRPVWLTLGAAALGATVELAWYGTVVEPSWAWTIGPLFVGATGLLTQVAPTTGYARQVGTAVDTDTIWLDPQSGIALT